jgi:hypothetical protein
VGYNARPDRDISQPDPVDAAIARIAVRQHGNVTRLALLRLGLDDHAIRHRVKGGRLHRVHWGVYSVGRPPATPLERAAAAVLACGSGAILSHGSAAALWGLQKIWREPLHVTVPGDRRPPRIRVHRSTRLIRRDVRTQLGIRVSSPARTVLDCAPELSDRALTRMVQDARLAGYLNERQLADVIARFPRHPGAQRLKPSVEVTGPPTRSGFEDDFLAFCESFGLPRPRVNARVAGYEVDALFEAEQLIVELDGWAFHADRDAFERDRDRDADTLAAGCATVRITWERMRRAPAHEAARLQAILTGRRGRRAA